MSTDPIIQLRQHANRRNSVWSYVAWIFFAALIALCVAYTASIVMEAYKYAHDSGSYVESP